MIYAITKNKAGRNFNTDEEQVNWKQLFKTSEDSLTSTVFERLFYLPSDLFYKILKEACYGNDLPEYAGKVLVKEFWPHWDGINTDNKQMVEPDVFIRFEEFDLIIEAKRWDAKQQSPTQWRNEIISYGNEYAEDNKKIYLLALGGLHSQKTEEEDGIKIVKCKWSRILSKVLEHRKFSANQSNNKPLDEMVTAILNDLVMAFRIHGFFTGEWFESIPLQKYDGIDSEKLLAQNIIKFDLKNWFNTLPTNYKINSTHKI